MSTCSVIYLFLVFPSIIRAIQMDKRIRISRGCIQGHAARLYTVAMFPYCRFFFTNVVILRDKVLLDFSLERLFQVLKPALSFQICFSRYRDTLYLCVQKHFALRLLWIYKGTPNEGKNESFTKLFVYVFRIYLIFSVSLNADLPLSSMKSV